MDKKDNSLTLPHYIQVGGQKVDIELVDSIEYNVLGRCHLSEGIIKIADSGNGRKQSDDSKLNTFIHECVHAILENMGRTDLNQDEVFVCSFTGFTTEIIKSILEQYDNR